MANVMRRVWRDSGVWTLITYTLVRGNASWQPYLDALAVIVGALVVARLYRTRRAA